MTSIHTKSFKSGVILKDNRIVIPKSLQQRILDLAHETHQGIVKTKLMLREKVWWPGIDLEIEELIKLYTLY